MAAVALGALAFGLFSSDDEKGEATLEESVLRLSDLARGYSIGDDGNACGPLTPEGRPQSLDTILGMTFPQACYNQFERFDGFQPEVIETAVVELETVAMAQRAIAVAPALGRYLLGSPEDAEPQPYDFGDEALLYEYVDGNGNPNLVLMWRSGSRISMIGQQGSPLPDPLSSILTLAKKQQSNGGTPRPLTATDADDRTVVLDRTDLGVPVYWLDDRFEPAGTLPALALSRGFGPLVQGSSSAGNKVQIDYDEPYMLTPSPQGLPAPDTWVRLTIWETTAWETFLQSELGDLATAAPCGEPTVIQLADRRIEIHAPIEGQSPTLPGVPNLGERSSDRRDRTLPPDPNGSNQCPPNYVGHVYFSDAVVAINLAISFASGGPGGGAYNTAAGVEAVGRALKKR